VKSALKLASIFVMAFVVAMLLVEWMIGCGESYVDANGVRHQYECAFIPQSKESK